MYSLWILTFIAFILTLLLTPLTRDWSVRLGLVDRPDGRRKLHRADIPRTGGVALLFSYGGAYALWFLLPMRASGVVREHIGSVGRLLPAVGLVFAIGLLDDWLDLKPWQKLTGQLAAAVWAYAAGVRIVAVA